MKIFKYNLNHIHCPELIKLPKDAKITGFGIQMQKPVMWALVDEDNVLEERKFILAFTGKNIPGNVIKSYNTIDIGGGYIATLLELKT